MQNVKAWLEDRRNLPIVLVAVIIVLALVALYFLKVTGKIGGGPKPAMQPPAPAYGPSAPTVPGAPAPTTPGARLCQPEDLLQVPQLLEYHHRLVNPVGAQFHLLL
jgi:hypothetical protein